jgi:hypothetical protein
MALVLACSLREQPIREVASKTAITINQLSQANQVQQYAPEHAPAVMAGRQSKLDRPSADVSEESGLGVAMLPWLEVQVRLNEDDD